MRIDILGSGGIGSYLIPVLMKQVSSDTEVHVWDGDKLEAKNLDRQLFPKRYVGRYKVDAMEKLYKGIIPHQQYVISAHTFKDSDMLFACPDNMPARKLVLEAADLFNLEAFICGNTYEAASASYYSSDFSGSALDYRVRYSEAMKDTSGDPTVGCTGEALESDPQLAIANQISASFAMCLYWFWTQKAPLVRGTDVFNLSPLEYRWAPSTIKTTTISDCVSAVEK